MASDFGFVWLDYDEEYPNTSDIVVGATYRDKKEYFDTGDVVADFKSAIRWLDKIGAPETVYSSSVDNLCMDSDIYYYTKAGYIGRKVRDGNKETRLVSSQGIEPQ